MEKIRIAQIGTSENSHGNDIWMTLLKNEDMFEIVGYAMPENEHEKFPQRMKAFEGYREMTVEEILNDPTIEAVTVETEEIYLTKHAIMVAKAGKHLHMEKPGGTELAPFKELVGILRDKQLVFSLGYMYRFNVKIREALEKVRRGDLGKIYAVEAHMDIKHPYALKQWLEKFPGGMMFFLGCHLLDLIYQIQGEPEEVIPMNCCTGFDGVTAQDYGMAVLKYPNGVSFAKTCAHEYGGFERRQLVICGEKGTIEIKPLEGYDEKGLYTVCHEVYEDGVHAAGGNSSSSGQDRYCDMMRNFGEMVRGKENPYGYDYELNLYKLVLRACGK